MKAYVVNLARSSDRRRHVEGELAKAGMDYELITAVDGRDLTLTDESTLVDMEVQRRWPDWLLPGIIGASLSHREAYMRMLANGDHAALVLEDDVVLPPNLSAVLDQLEPHHPGSDVTLLYYRGSKPCVFSSVSAVGLPTPGLKVMYPMDLAQPVSAAAYVISQEAARRMVDFVLPVRAGPDNWAMFHEEGAVARIRCVVPRVVDLRSTFASTIEYTGGTARLRRVTRAMLERRIFPLPQVSSLLRWRRERGTREFEIVDEPSPHMPTGETSATPCA